MSPGLPAKSAYRETGCQGSTCKTPYGVMELGWSRASGSTQGERDGFLREAVLGRHSSSHGLPPGLGQPGPEPGAYTLGEICANTADGFTLSLTSPIQTQRVWGTCTVQYVTGILPPKRRKKNEKNA